MRPQTLMIPIVAALAAGAADAQCLVQELDSGGEPKVFFGTRVAIDGDRIYVGDPKGTTAQGRVYVFEWNGSRWEPVTTLVSSIESNTDNFPTGFAFNDDTVFLANRNTLAMPGQSGAVELFDKSSLQPIGLVLPPYIGFGSFAAVITLRGDQLLVSAPLTDLGEVVDAGVVVAYTWTGAEWAFTQVIENPLPIQFASFGSAISFTAPDKVLIGAHGGSGPGVVQEFRLSNGQWVHIDTIAAPPLPGPDQWFGRSIGATDDQTIIIGSPRALAEPLQSGAAHQYAFTGEWTELQTIIPSSPTIFSFFGGTPKISEDGTYAAIDAPSDKESEFSEGAVYVYDRDERGLFKERIKILAPPGSDGFGNQAMQGDIAVMGAGKAFVYRGMSGIDCNNNGLPDSCDVIEGRAADLNNNLIPDACECPGDADGDGVVTSTDLNLVLVAFGVPQPAPAPGLPANPADFDADGDVDTDDLNMVLKAFGGECELP